MSSLSKLIRKDCLDIKNCHHPSANNLHWPLLQASPPPARTTIESMYYFIPIEIGQYTQNSKMNIITPSQQLEKNYSRRLPRTQHSSATPLSLTERNFIKAD